VRRGEVYWGDLGPDAGRRPVVIITRNAAIPALRRVVTAPVTTNVRGLESEVRLGPEEGLRTDCAASCDNLITVPKTVLDPAPVGSLGFERLRELDDALRYALEIRF
jgi:mRNA interferase MazF